MEEKDLDALFKFIENASPQWRNIGTALGFRKVDLDAITTKAGLKEDAHFFQELLLKWLNWAPPDHSFPFTEDLATALQKDYGRLALKLRSVKNNPFMSDERLESND